MKHFFVIIFLFMLKENSAQYFNCGQTLEFSGVNYPTIGIGNQCWLGRNLNVGVMVNSKFDQSNNSSIEKYCYDNNLSNCSLLGGLYQWSEAVQYQNGASNVQNMQTPYMGNLRGICPNGWHIPSDKEWKTLENFLGGPNNTSGALKSSIPFEGFFNKNANNSSRFSALPAGACDVEGNFFGLGAATRFWSANEYSESNIIAINRYLDFENTNIGTGFVRKNYGFSVRCLLD
jgi:uncharacterized protein (TIGR02145 family)